MNHEEFYKMHRRTLRIAGIGMVVVPLIGLGSVAALVYVAAHFLAKVW